MRLCLLMGLLCPVAALGVVVGERAPQFPLPSMDATAPPVSLAEYRGKVVYLNFLSAWCAPCRDAMPALAALRQRFPIKALEIIGINVDPAPEAGRRALATLDFRYPTASDPAADSAIIYGVETLPAAFIVDAEGIVRHVQRGAGQKDIGKEIDQAEAMISALIATSFDAVSRTGFERRDAQTRTGRP